MKDAIKVAWGGLAHVRSTQWSDIAALLRMHSYLLPKFCGKKIFAHEISAWSWSEKLQTRL